MAACDFCSKHGYEVEGLVFSRLGHKVCKDCLLVCEEILEGEREPKPIPSKYEVAAPTDIPRSLLNRRPRQTGEARRAPVRGVRPARSQFRRRIPVLRSRAGSGSLTDEPDDVRLLCAGTAEYQSHRRYCSVAAPSRAADPRGVPVRAPVRVDRLPHPRLDNRADASRRGDAVPRPSRGSPTGRVGTARHSHAGGAANRGCTPGDRRIRHDRASRCRAQPERRSSADLTRHIPADVAHQEELA